MFDLTNPKPNFADNRGVFFFNKHKRDDKKTIDEMIELIRENKKVSDMILNDEAFHRSKL